MWPLIGVSGAIGGASVLMGIGITSRYGKIIQSMLIGLGVLSAAPLIWLGGLSIASVFAGLSIVVGCMLLYHLWDSAQQGAPADAKSN